MGDPLPMEHVRWHLERELRNPVVVAAFTGWNDAGDAASTAVTTLIEGWNAELIASIDPEPFTDFASTRPMVVLRNGITREIRWPQVAIWAASTPGVDVLLVVGPEPSLRWRLFTEQLLGLVQRFGCSMVLTLGALLADVPHTKPVQLIGNATDPELIERFDLETSTYEGPTGIVGVLHDACAKAGVPSASLWAATPAYAASVPSPKAALALLRRATDLIGAPAPAAELVNELETYEAQVDELVETDDELPSYVRRLEALVGDDDEDDEPIDTEDAGEHLIEELEQFLRDQDPE
jgi:predicted ATP-grasp superfamily ATP-dependent carboligase